MDAPDLTEPIVGFRAWHAGAGGQLVPWSAGAAGAWVEGVNTATCLAHPTGAGHVAPVAACTCGLYALATIEDARLRPSMEVVGAIVAWGDVEVHATGFRAQHAALVALGMPAHPARGHRDRILLAAERYGVAVVPVTALPAAASEFGVALDFARLPRRPRAPAAAERRAPPLTSVGATATAIADHLTVQITRSGVRLSLTGALAEEAVGAPSPVPVAGSNAIRRGDPLVRVDGRRGALVLASPLSGLLATADGGDAGWVLELIPTRWDEEAADLAWGAAGERLYAAEVADAARHGDSFRAVRSQWLRAHAHVRSAADVLAALRAAGDEPRFGSEAQVYAEIGGRLRQALADPVVARRLARMPVRVLWRLHDPGADLLVDLTGPVPRLETGLVDERADLVLFASAQTADGYLAGRVDLPAALRGREVQTSAPVAAVLRAESVLKALKPAYAAARTVRAPRPADGGLGR